MRTFLFWPSKVFENIQKAELSGPKTGIKTFAKISSSFVVTDVNRSLTGCQKERSVYQLLATLELKSYLINLSKQLCFMRFLAEYRNYASFVGNEWLWFYH